MRRREKASRRCKQPERHPEGPGRWSVRLRGPTATGPYPRHWQQARAGSGQASVPRRTQNLTQNTECQERFLVEAVLFYTFTYHGTTNESRWHWHIIKFLQANFRLFAPSFARLLWWLWLPGNIRAAISRCNQYLGKN